MTFFGRVAQIKDAGQPVAAIQSYGYSLDGAAQVITATDPKGNITQTWKDAWGRTAKVSLASGPYTEYQYDAADRLTRVDQKKAGHQRGVRHHDDEL